VTGALSSWTIYCVSYLINAGGEFSLTYGWDPRADRWGFGVGGGSTIALRLQIYTMLKAFAQPYVALPPAALCRFHFTVCALEMYTVITYQSEGGSLDKFNQLGGGHVNTVNISKVSVIILIRRLGVNHTLINDTLRRTSPRPLTSNPSPLVQTWPRSLAVPRQSRLLSVFRTKPLQTNCHSSLAQVLKIQSLWLI
jgi:hypothetical protein